MELIRITPDRERAKSLLETVAVRLDAIKLLQRADSRKFCSKIVEEYYESVLELITAIMSIDGFKTRSDAPGSHIAAIEYVQENYKELEGSEIEMIDDLRKKRIGITYYGRHVREDYIESNKVEIERIIEKLRLLVRKKLE
ncbi:MAG: hypothetical protein MUP55_00370 [Candidatus Aenigmarchaeota archaeon]|nr:hypothetical protein [Candidatus Aenigmarchaeota archaeon]